MPGRPNTALGCGTAMAMTCRPGAPDARAGRRQRRRLAGQLAEGAVQQGLQRVRIDIARDRDLHAAAHPMGLRKGLEIGGSDGADAGRIAIDRMGIGMAVEHVADRRRARRSCRALLRIAAGRPGSAPARAPPHRHRSADATSASPRRRNASFAWLLSVTSEIVQVIAAGRDRQADAAAVERGLKGLRAQLARALVEQRGGEGGKPRLVRRIIGRAGRQRRRHGDHRQGVVLDIPDLGALAGVERLHIDGQGRGRRQNDEGGAARRQACGARRFAAPSLAQARALARAGQEIAGHRLVRLELRLRHRAHGGAVTASMRFGHCSTSIAVSPITSARP